MLTMLQYPVSLNTFTLAMHEGSAVVSVGMVNGKPVLWALSDKDAPLVPHLFVTVETGKDVPEAIAEFLFIGTFQSPSGLVSLHLFDAGEAEEGEDEGA